VRGEDVRRIRRRLGLTQVQFAELVGVHSNSVARWERNELTIRESAARLMQLLSSQHPAARGRSKRRT
jgi:DNA-binding transcriptional regulator YiaG